jgi:hypothetical protein
VPTSNLTREPSGPYARTSLLAFSLVLAPVLPRQDSLTAGLPAWPSLHHQRIAVCQRQCQAQKPDRACQWVDIQGAKPPKGAEVGLDSLVGWSVESTLDQDGVCVRAGVAIGDGLDEGVR